MSTTWTILSSTIILILALGGLSYILSHFVGQDDPPTPQSQKQPMLCLKKA